jgi:hypothetical protein
MKEIKEYSREAGAVVRVAVEMHNLYREHDAATEMQLSIDSPWLLP